MINKYLNFAKYQANSRQSSVWFRVSATSAKSQSIKLIKPIKYSKHPKLNPSLRHKQALQHASISPFSNRQDLQKLSEFYLSKVAKLAGLILLPSVFIAPAQAASAVKNGQRVLMVEMTPALCSLQPTRARMRQCLEGYSFTISGLDLGYGERCGRGSEPRLTPLQLKVVNRIMPDTTVRSQVWHRYGTCSPLSANSYFRQIINYAGDLKLPSELTTGNSYTVSKSSFLKQMTSLNSGMDSSDIDLICQAGSRRQSVLTDINVCYEGNNFASCSNVIDSCGKKFIISGGQ